MSMAMIEAEAPKRERSRMSNMYRTLPASEVPVGAWHRSGETFRIAETLVNGDVVRWRYAGSEDWHVIGHRDTPVLVEVEVDESTL